MITINGVVFSDEEYGWMFPTVRPQVVAVVTQVKGEDKPIIHGGFIGFARLDCQCGVGKREACQPVCHACENKRAKQRGYNHTHLNKVREEEAFRKAKRINFKSCLAAVDRIVAKLGRG